MSSSTRERPTGQVAPNAATSGGCTPYHYLSSGATNQDSTTVKAAAGQIYYLTACNTNASARYLKLYDNNNNPTSSNTPVFTLLIPPNNSGFEQPIPVGMSFVNGISFRITGGMADSDTTSASMGDCAINLGYK